MDSDGGPPEASGVLNVHRWSTTTRLDTFQNAPRQTAGGISYSELASDGYKYVKEKNCLQCVYCLASISNWRNVTSVDALKRQHKSNCDPLRDDSWAETDDCQVDGVARVSSPASEFPDADNRVLEIDLNQVRQTAGGVNPVKVENDQLRAQMRCRRCGQCNVETLFLPCRHLVSCERCAEESNYCFHCNAKILGTVRTYLN